MLIEKDGGIRPCEVLATCLYKVLHSTLTSEFGKDKPAVQPCSSSSSKRFFINHNLLIVSYLSIQDGYQTRVGQPYPGNRRCDGHDDSATPLRRVGFPG